jgi:hypothetical protein
MTISGEELSPLRLLALPVLLSLIDGERTCSDISRQAGLSISKVNSVLEELLLRRLVVETSPLVRDQFVEPRFQIVDDELARTTITNELTEDPIPYILQILDRVRNEMPKAVQQGTKAQVWYSRLVLTPDITRRIMERLIQVMDEFEAMQNSTEAEDEGMRDHYRLSIVFYQVGSTPSASES